MRQPEAFFSFKGIARPISITTRIGEGPKTTLLSYSDREQQRDSFGSTEKTRQPARCGWSAFNSGNADGRLGPPVSAINGQPDPGQGAGDHSGHSCG